MKWNKLIITLKGSMKTETSSGLASKGKLSLLSIYLIAQGQLISIRCAASICPALHAAQNMAAYTVELYGNKAGRHPDKIIPLLSSNGFTNKCTCTYWPRVAKAEPKWDVDRQQLPSLY
jgi:hypothetical protein